MSTLSPPTTAKAPTAISVDADPQAAELIARRSRDGAEVLIVDWLCASG
jgi:hypothetical protein